MSWGKRKAMRKIEFIWEMGAKCNQPDTTFKVVDKLQPLWQNCVVNFLVPAFGGGTRVQSGGKADCSEMERGLFDACHFRIGCAE